MDLVDAAELAGLEIISRRGNEHSAHCTVHDDEHASVSINPEKDVWCCYGCGTGGHGAESFLRYFAPSLVVATVPTPRAQVDPAAEASAGRLFVATAAIAPAPDFMDVDRAVISGEFVRVRALCLRIIGARCATSLHRDRGAPRPGH